MFEHRSLNTEVNSKSRYRNRNIETETGLINTGKEMKTEIN